MQQVFDERLGRYQAAIALETSDRIPIAPAMNYLCEIYTGRNNQEIIYDAQAYLQAEMDFIKAFPETDTMRLNKIWAPICDVLYLKTYKLPGRDLPVMSQFQFVEEENMKTDEYDVLIDNPAQFMMERFIPRVFGEYGKGSARSHFSMLKAGIAQGMRNEINRNRLNQLQTQCGMPQAALGGFIAPFDILANALRGLKGALMDTFRHPDKVVAACDVLAPIMTRFALAGADPLKRYPICVPTHKPCFLSPKQFDTFYWPSFKKILVALVNSGYKVRILLEGDWSKHWHHLLELPKGSLICDLDNQCDIFLAKKEIGYHQCITGGLQDSMLILGTPQEVEERVKLLCETVGKDGGFIISGGCNIPYDTKPENYRAMIDAIMKYGWYDKNFTPKPKEVPVVANDLTGLAKQGMLTPWEVKCAELGGVSGDEDLVRKPWETIESIAFNWLWGWTW